MMEKGLWLKYFRDLLGRDPMLTNPETRTLKWLQISRNLVDKKTFLDTTFQIYDVRSFQI